MHACYYSTQYLLYNKSRRYNKINLLFKSFIKNPTFRTRQAKFIAFALLFFSATRFYVSWFCKPMIAYVGCIVIIGNLLLLRHVEDRPLQEDTDADARLVYIYSALEADNRSSTPNATYVKSDIGDMTQFHINQTRKLVIGVHPPNSSTHDEDLDERYNQGLAKQYYSRRATKVNPFQYHIIARPQSGCDVDTYVIILVHSFHPYRDKRDAIRKTWGSVVTGGAWPKEQITKKLRLVFVLGTHVESKYNDVIRSELKQHDDVIQGDFIDDYTNMTLKSLLGLKYVSEACPSTPFLLKSDDDMFINIPYLLKILQSKTYNRSIMGPRNWVSRPERVGKWGVSRQLFPFKRYPVYESGAAYVISGDLVPELFETSEYVPAFHVDDVYITGVLGRILNVTHVRQKGFAYWGDKIPTACDMLQKRKITGTKMTPERLTDLWRNMSTIAC